MISARKQVGAPRSLAEIAYYIYSLPTEVESWLSFSIICLLKIMETCLE